MDDRVGMYLSKLSFEVGVIGGGWGGPGYEERSWFRVVWLEGIEGEVGGESGVGLKGKCMLRRRVGVVCMLCSL